MWSMLYSVTLYYNIGRGEGGEKACFRDLGVVSVIEFKNEFVSTGFVQDCGLNYDLVSVSQCGQRKYSIFVVFRRL